MSQPPYIAYPVGEDARAYMREQIDKDDGDGIAIEARWDLSQGQVWAAFTDVDVAPTFEHADYEADFTWLFPPRSAPGEDVTAKLHDILVPKIESFLNGGEDRICVSIGDFPSAEWYRQRGEDSGFVEREDGWLRHYLLAPVPSTKEIEAVIRKSRGYYHFIILSSGVSDDHRRAIVEDGCMDFDTILDGMQMLVVGAFDLTDYLYWRPDNQAP